MRHWIDRTGIASSVHEIKWDGYQVQAHGRGSSGRSPTPWRSCQSGCGSTAWIKTKCERSDTFVVVGFAVDKQRPRQVTGLNSGMLVIQPEDYVTTSSSRHWMTCGP